MQTDAEETDAWWRAQDATRVPRNDLAQFACGQQLDITTVRLTLSESQLAAQRTIRGDVQRPDHCRASLVVHQVLVYYDAPVDDDDVCGQGGSDPSGFGLAVVYYQACIGISDRSRRLHELLHTLGAVPPRCAEPLPQRERRAHL